MPGPSWGPGTIHARRVIRLPAAWARWRRGAGFARFLCGHGRRRLGVGLGIGLGRCLTGLRALSQCLNGLLKVLEGVELAIHGREAQVGDHVEVSQERKDGLADLVRRHVGDAGGAQLLLDLLGQNRELIIRDRPPLTGLLYARYDLVTGERLDDAGALDDLERGRFKGGKALLAVRALTATPNRGAVVRNTRIDDARIRVMTERAVHPSTVHAETPVCHRSPTCHQQRRDTRLRGAVNGRAREPAARAGERPARH